MKQKLEIAHSGRKDDLFEYEEVLAYLPDGKVYLDKFGKPKAPVIQEAQKGGLCWYYALGLVRTHYGKEHEDGNRYVESVISKYRKGLTLAELLNSGMKIILENPPCGLKKEEVKLAKLPDLFVEGLTPDIIEQRSNDFKLFSFFVKVLIEFSPTKHPEFTPKLRQTLINALVKDLPNINEIKDIATNQTDSFLEFLNGLRILANKDIQDAKPEYKEMKNRLGIFFLACLFNMVDPIKKIKGFDDLTLEQVIDLIHFNQKIAEVKTLFKRLDIQATTEFFEKRLTAGVYNVQAKRVLKLEAERICKILNSDDLPISADEITAEDISNLDDYFRKCQILAYSHIVKRYGLQVTQWTPKNGFDGLMDAINHDGALVMCGRIGMSAFNGEDKPLTEQGKLVKIGSRSIRFWSNEQLKPMNDNSSGHSIVIIGAQRKKGEGVNEEFVFFLDPNDAQVPGEERKMYRMNYSDFVARLWMHNNSEITKIDCIPDDACYAVSARNGSMNL